MPWRQGRWIEAGVPRAPQGCLFFPRKDGRSERIRTSDPCVPNAVLYQAEPHSDLRRGLIATAFRARKRRFTVRENSLETGSCIARGLRVSRPPSGASAPDAPDLLGNGVMVTLRFLVPSFKVRVLVPQPSAPPDIAGDPRPGLTEAVLASAIAGSRLKCLSGCF